MKKLFGIILFVSMVLALFSSKKKDQPVELTGAGASFPAPLYMEMFDQYFKLTKNKVNYQSIGSGGGIKQLTDRAVDFGATDAFMSQAEMEKTGAEVLHIPTCLGGVVLAFNLPNIKDIRLTPELVADIFLGKIKNWNDPALVKENPGVNLPNMEIKVITRSDSSGTTYVFTDYLTKVSPEWKEKIGVNKSVNWPGSNVLSGKGNEGVAGLINQMVGSIGYIEISYATENNISFATLKNKAGKYIKPSLASIMASANVTLPEDTRVSITNTDNPDGYPITSFTWLIFYREQNYNNRSENQARQLVRLLRWIITDGQKYNEPLNYAKLPQAAVTAAQKILDKVTYNGKPIK